MDADELLNLLDLSDGKNYLKVNSIILCISTQSIKLMNAFFLKKSTINNVSSSKKSLSPSQMLQRFAITLDHVHVLKYAHAASGEM